MGLFGRVFGGRQAGGRIVSFDVVTLHESGMRFVREYEMVMKEDRAEVSLYGNRSGGNDKQRVLKKCAVCSRDAALSLLNGCGLLRWDGFSGPHPKGVRDGIMFTLNATVNEGKRIHASGSQNFPRHYRDFRDGLDRILDG